MACMYLIVLYYFKNVKNSTLKSWRGFPSFEITNTIKSIKAFSCSLQCLKSVKSCKVERKATGCNELWYRFSVSQSAIFLSNLHNSFSQSNSRKQIMQLFCTNQWSTTRVDAPIRWSFHSSRAATHNETLQYFFILPNKVQVMGPFVYNPL